MPVSPGKATEPFFDMYNKFVEFNTPARIAAGGDAIHSERGRVEDFDTQYYAELNLRYIGLLLQNEAVTHVPYRCPAVFDAAATNASQHLLWGNRDPYWPIYGHPPDEF